MNSKTLIIAGMHRSGTSLVAHYLSECGFYIGDELINTELTPDKASAGHHEDKAFLNFHNEALKAARVDVFVTDSNKLPVKISPELRSRGQQLIAARGHLPQWAWKDPRTTLFLDFWNELIDQPKCLFLFRHPLTVLDSILRRGKDKKITQQPIIGLRAWIVYNQQVLHFYKTHRQQSFLCEIDTVIHQPEQLKNKLERDWRFALNEVAFDAVFSKKAFNGNSPPSVQLGRRFAAEIETAEALYSQLVTMASSQS